MFGGSGAAYPRGPGDRGRHSPEERGRGLSWGPWRRYWTTGVVFEIAGVEDEKHQASQKSSVVAGGGPAELESACRSPAKTRAAAIPEVQVLLCSRGGRGGKSPSTAAFLSRLSYKAASFRLSLPSAPLSLIHRHSASHCTPATAGCLLRKARMLNARLAIRQHGRRSRGHHRNG